jgi:serine/threonine-protein kinase
MEHQRYKITDRIDTGGMAEVFRGIAESTVGGLKRNVAIKRILPSLTKNKKFVSMFLDEARLSLHLQHANIVQVTDIGAADMGAQGAAYFLVMEYVDGANLKTILEYLRKVGQRMPISHTLYIMMEVCKALAYAHELVDPEGGRPLGIVHRDISPPNILISRRGEVKLADFGLAKAASQIENTDPGVVKGKFSYLSPEAAQGEEVDQRADIFAVGILLYELFTGRRLFEGETDYQTVEMIRAAQIPAISPQNPEVDGELEDIVRKALARDPAHRYQRADDLGDAMAQYLFSKGQRLKVTSRDLENLVARCLAERRGRTESAATSLIDTLIQDEILKFTSLDELDDDTPERSRSDRTGTTPLNPEQFAAPRSEELIDPRIWASEGESGSGHAPPQDEPGRPGPRAPSSESPPSLEQLLEGTGTGTRIPVPEDGNHVKWFILAILLVAGVGALIYFLI